MSGRPDSASDRPELGVDVFVREEGGGRPEPADDQAKQDVRAHEGGEERGGTGPRAREGGSGRRHSVGCWAGRDGHALSIGGRP